MKALIFSDSHGGVSSMADFCLENPDAELIIFAGDMQSDIKELMELFPKKRYEIVRGNNDYFCSEVPYDRVFKFGDKCIFLTHGHRYNVKSGVYSLYLAAREKGADICIFGHTHMKFKEAEGDVILFNPGSARKSCGILEVCDGEVRLDFL